MSGPELNQPIIYRGAYNPNIGPKDQVLRVIGSSHEGSRPKNQEHKRLTTEKPKNPKSPKQEDELSQEIKSSVENIKQETIIEQEINQMKPLHRVICSARKINSIERQELDLIRTNSLKGRRSARVGRTDSIDYNCDDDFIPGEAIEWL